MAKVHISEITTKFIKEKLPKIYSDLITEGKQKEKERALKFLKMKNLDIPLNVIMEYYKSGIDFEDFIMKIAEERKMSASALKEAFNLNLNS